MNFLSELAGRPELAGWEIWIYRLIAVGLAASLAWWALRAALGAVLPPFLWLGKLALIAAFIVAGLATAFPEEACPIAKSMKLPLACPR